MEEDLETLEDLKNIFIHLKNYGWVNDIKKEVVADKVIKAIENLIARNKELEELLEEKTIRLGFENQDNYIPKSKVRDKVIEVKDRPVTNDFITATQGKLNTIIDLEDLLQEGDK